MELGRTIVVTEVNLGTTVYGCYVETISGITYSYFRNRYMENGTAIDIYTSPSVQWQGEFRPEIGATNIQRAYIPYYGISGKALNGVCFKNRGLDPTSQPQAFNWRASSRVEGDINYNNARVFNFQRGPTVIFTPFVNETMTNYHSHHIQITNTEFICDTDTYHFNDCEPCVVCYVISSKDAKINNSVGSKIPFRKNSNPSSPPLLGISWYHEDNTFNEQYDSWLSGTTQGVTAYYNNTVHLYKIKLNANINLDIFSDWDDLCRTQPNYIQEITTEDPLYPLYYNLVKPTGDHYTYNVIYTGLNPQGKPWIPSWEFWGTDHIHKHFQTGTRICDTYNIKDYTDTAGWTGTFTLSIDVTTPLVGMLPMPRMAFGNLGGWVATYERRAQETWTSIGLKGAIQLDYPGLWNPHMCLNFLDQRPWPYTITDSKGVIHEYTSKGSEWDQFACVFLTTDNTYAPDGGVVSGIQNNSNYIFIVPWDCG